MNILVIGSGGREHALAWKLAQSKLTEKLYIAPGNAGTREVGENVPLDLNDFRKIRDFILAGDISMVVVGPEEPLVKGLVDYLRSSPGLEDVIMVGPGEAGAQLEGSKAFAKAFMKKYGIPTASCQSFDHTREKEGMEFLTTLQPPYVLKADGLAAGKGVLITSNLRQAQLELGQMYEGKFGEAGRKVVIEEYLKGIELSVFVLTDGKSYKLLPAAKDYKQIGEGNTGLNTGGMGSVSPVPFAGEAFMQKVEEKIIQRTMDGLNAEGIDYQGFIFFGLMKVGEDPYVVEYNVRMGDPEAEAVIPRIKNDLVEVLRALASRSLDKVEMALDERAVSTVMMVSGGYPEKYEKGKPITGLFPASEDAVIFHAGTKAQDDGTVVTNGGRVLSVSAYGRDIFQALEKSYETIRQISFENAHYRKDIGFDLK